MKVGDLVRYTHHVNVGLQYAKCVGRIGIITGIEYNNVSTDTVYYKLHIGDYHLYVTRSMVEVISENR